MKKHDEGYALVLVLVVMVVLCLVAMTMMSLSLRNMENQRSSVEQMQDRYAAEGAIEAFLAEFGRRIGGGTPITREVSAQETLNAILATQLAKEEQINSLTATIRWDEPYWSEPVTGRSDPVSGTLVVVAETEHTRIECKMALSGYYVVAENIYQYYINMNYQSYTITTPAEGGEAA